MNYQLQDIIREGLPAPQGRPRNINEDIAKVPVKGLLGQLPYWYYCMEVFDPNHFLIHEFQESEQLLEDQHSWRVDDFVSDRAVPSVHQHKFGVGLDLERDRQYSIFESIHGRRPPEYDNTLDDDVIQDPEFDGWYLHLMNLTMMHNTFRRLPIFDHSSAIVSHREQFDPFNVDTGALITNEVINGDDEERLWGYVSVLQPRAKYFYYDLAMGSYVHRLRHIIDREALRKKVIYSALSNVWAYGPLLPQGQEEVCSPRDVLLRVGPTILDIWRYIRDERLVAHIVLTPEEQSALIRFTHSFTFVLHNDLINVYTNAHLVGVLVQAASRRFAIVHSQGYISLNWKSRGVMLDEMYFHCDRCEQSRFGRCFNAEITFQESMFSRPHHFEEDQAIDTLTRQFDRMSYYASASYGARASAAHARKAKERKKKRRKKTAPVLQSEGIEIVSQGITDFIPSMTSIRQQYASAIDTINTVDEVVSKGRKVYKYFATGEPVHPPANFIDGVLSKIESMIFLLGTLYRCDQTTVSYVFAIGQWLKAMGFQSSLSGYIHGKLDILFRVAPFPVLDEEDESLESQGLETWSLFDIGPMIKRLFTDWKSIKDSHFVISLMDVYTEMVVNGWLPELSGSKERYSITGFAMEMINKKVAEKRKDSSCLLECIFDSVIYIVEHVYAAVANGSLSFLFLESAELAKLESEYTDIVAAQDMIENEDVHRYDGNIPFADMDDYSNRVDALLAKFEAMRDMDARGKTKNQIMQSPFHIRILMLKKIKTVLVEHFRNCSIREKPFAVLVYGGTGVGKTTITQLIIAHLAPTLGIQYDKDGMENKICHVNEADKFDSDYRQGHEVVIIDDMANKKIEHYKDGGPVDKFLRIVNTASTAALKADVGSKGNVFYRPKLVIVTTNEKKLLSEKFSNEPASIMRRFDAVLTCTVNSPFANKDQSLNAGAYKASGSLFPDAWRVKLQTVSVERTPRVSDGARDGIKFVPVFDEMMPLLDVIIKMRGMCIEHMDKQQNMVAEVRKLHTPEVWCDCPYGTKWLRTHCPVCREVGEEVIEFSDDDESVKGEPMNVFSLTSEGSIISAGDKSISQVKHVVDQFRQMRSSFTGDPLLIDKEITYIKGWDDLAALDSVAPGEFWDVDDEHGILNWVHKKLYVPLDDLVGTYVADFLVGFVGSQVAWYSFKALKAFIVHMFSYSSLLLQPEAAEEVKITKLSGDTKVVRKIPVQPPLQTVEATSTTPAALRKLLHNHLLTLTFTQRNTSTGSHVTRRGIGVPLSGAFVLVPRHILFEGAFTYKAECTYDHNLKESTTDSHNYEIVGSGQDDLAIIYLPSIGPRKAFIKYFPRKGATFAVASATLLTRRDSANYEILAENFRERQELEADGNHFVGYLYTPSEKTQRGDCAGPIVSNTCAAILGVHLAGNAGGRITGACASPYMEELEDAMARISERDHSSAIHSEGDYQFRRFGVSDVFKDGSTIPARHALNKLDCDEPTMRVYGPHSKGSAKFVSHITRFPRAAEVEEAFGVENIHCTFRECKGKTIDTGEQWFRDLSKLAVCQSLFHPTYWRFAREDFRKRVREVCCYPSNVGYLSQTGKITNSDNLNGVDGVNYIYPIDFATSAGYPLNRSKREYLVPSETRDFVPVIWEEVAHLEQLLLKGERCFAPFRACLKDEVLKRSKPKLRVFSGCNVAFTLLTRRYYLTLIRFICQNWLHLECAVGINAYGDDWGALARYLQEKGGTGDTQRIIAGDYSSFDKTMSPEATLAAFDILLLISEYGNYDDDDRKIMRGIATEICFPLYEYDGVFLQVNGSNPSGHPLTVIVNSLVNSLYQRYAFKIHYPSLYFTDHVHLTTFGDDNVAGVAEDVPLYNMGSITDALEQARITYTLSDLAKGDGHNVVYQRLEDVSYLKRGFVYDVELGRWMAPLAATSIMKSAMYYNFKRNPNTTIVTELFAQGLVNTLREWVFHGRDVFEDKRSAVLGLLHNAGSDKYLNLWTYEEYIETLKSYPPRILGGNWIVWIQDEEEDSLRPPVTLQLEGVTDVVRRPDLRIIETVIDDDEWSTLLLQKTDRPGMGCPSLVRIIKRPTKIQQRRVATTEVSHGEDHADNDPVILTSQADLVEFTDTAQDQVGTNVPYERTLLGADTPQHDLNSFLSRPIKIRYMVIPATNTTFALTFSPWTDFLSNKRIINRINNYAYIRGKLRLKFTINGTPFHYGRILVSYEPLPGTRTVADVNPFSTFDRGDMMRASQRLHCYLNPTTNQGAELCLPFIWPENALTLAATNFDSVGKIFVHSIANIVSLSASASPVYVSVFAWMEDVELIAPTTANAGLLVAQGDEYGKTNISDVATGISAAAGTLDKVPIIGKYAKATSMAAGAVASIARAAGFSKPCIIDQPDVVRPTAVGNMTNFNTSDPAVRMTMDAKQELTVDPTTVGLPSEDDMIISNITKRESYFCSFLWDINSPTNTRIFALAVTPKLFNVSTPAVQGVFKINTTPSAWVSTNFKYWRGTLRLRFQVVRSMYHSGRLRVVFDPVAVSGDLFATSTDNLVYSWIIDLSEKDDVTVDCGWVQRTNYLPLHRDRTDLFNDLDDPYLNAANPLSFGVANGAVSVHVVTPLVVPDSSLTYTNCQVLVSASWEDLELAVPSEDGLKGYTYMPKLTAQGSELQSQGIDVMTQDLVPDVSGDAHVTLYSPQPLDQTDSVFMGEKIISLRQILKRYCNHCSHGANPAISATLSSYRVLQPNFPFASGYYPGAPFVDSSAARVSYSNMTLLNYYTPGFIGWRGSIRWKIVRDGLRGAFTAPLAVMTVHAVDTNIFDTNTTAIPAFSTVSGYASWNYTNGPTGASALVLAQSSVNPTLEFEIPFYSHYRMASARDLQLGSTSPDAISPSIRPAVRGFSYRVKTASALKDIHNMYVAAGEDFTLFGFLNTPVLYLANYTTNEG